MEPMTFAARFLRLEQRLYTRLRRHADDRLARRATAANKRRKPAHLLTGERGEDAAFFHLRSLGYTIVARRWHTRSVRGDIDLIAWDGDTLIAFEVKTRTGHDFYPAEDAVDRDKRNQLRRQARTYMGGFPREHRGRLRIRFDILAVYLTGDGAEFQHFPAAFPYDAPREDWKTARTARISAQASIHNRRAGV
jgi:putative endonuclease